MSKFLLVAALALPVAACFNLAIAQEAANNPAPATTPSAASKPAGATFTEDDLRAEYAYLVRHLDREEVRVRHILVRTQNDAKRVMGMLKTGLDFVSVAKSLSLDSKTNTQGGELGWLRPSSLPPSLRAAVTTLRDGEQAPNPVQTKSGWHVIERIDSQSLTPKPYQELKNALQKDLQEFADVVEREKNTLGALDKHLFTPILAPPRMRLLLSNGANVNAKNGKGQTPLHLESLLGHEENVRILLVAGADPNIETNDGGSAINYAIGGTIGGYSSIVELLLKAGVPPDKPDVRGLFPIHRAAYGNNVSAIRFLAKAGANIDRPDNQNHTPLMLAAISKASDAVQVLLELGANPLSTRQEKNRSKTALDFALQAKPAADEKLYVAAVDALRQASIKAAMRNSKQSFEVFVTQEGKRVKVAGQSITLKRTPFSLIFELKNTDSVLVHSSFAPTVTSALLAGQAAKTTFASPWSTAAESTTGSEQILFVYDGTDRGHQSWWQSTEGTRFDKMEIQNDKKIGTRIIHKIAVIPLDPNQTGEPRNIEERHEPLFVSFALVEPMGSFEQAVVQYRHAKILWKP